MSDGPNNRSIFYQFLFAQLGEEELKGGEDRRIHNKKLKDSVFNKMIQEFEPQVSLVDVASGMTPLELAISKNNLVIAEVGGEKKKKNFYLFYIYIAVAPPEC